MAENLAFESYMYCLPESQCCCGQEYEVMSSRTHYVIDLPKITPEATQYNTLSYHYTGCGVVYEDPPFQGAEQ